MLIKGKWHQCDDGVVRPTVRVRVADQAGATARSLFLVDVGADFTVLCASALANLNLPRRQAPHGAAVQGIGGLASSIFVRAILGFSSVDGRTVRFHAEVAAFTDPLTSDLSILGRDVLDQFDVIVSRRRDEVLLLFAKSQYQVSAS